MTVPLYSAPDYHAEAQGIKDIYWQELLRPPDEGGWIEWFWHWREEGRSFEWIRAEIRKSPEWHAIHDAPQAQRLPLLVPHGGVFIQEDGTPWTWIGTSDFNLLSRYIHEGEQVARAIMKERADLGFNTLRVWTAFSGNPQFEAEIGHLLPGEVPDFYVRVGEFLGLASAYGLYVELTAFTGLDIPGHWEHLGQAVQGHTNAFLELVNEHNAHPSINLALYTPHPGVMCSHGSNGSEATPVRPEWNYETFHTNDAFEWQRKVGHNAMELSSGAQDLHGSGVPVVADENTRPDRDGNLNHHQDGAAGAALLCAGSTFHSQSGKKSELFDERDRAAAQSWVYGVRSVDLRFQPGRYSHSTADEGQGILRAYRRTLPDGAFGLVKIRV